MQDEQALNLIKIRIEEGLRALDDQLTLWLKEHLCPARRIQAIINYELGTKKTFWLITDHTGHNDAGKRVVYDAEKDRFGLVSTTMAGAELFLSYYKNFAETVYSI
jgi:hypothetical protein